MTGASVKFFFSCSQSVNNISLNIKILINKDFSVVVWDGGEK